MVFNMFVLKRLTVFLAMEKSVELYWFEDFEPLVIFKKQLHRYVISSYVLFYTLHVSMCLYSIIFAPITTAEIFHISVTNFPPPLKKSKFSPIAEIHNIQISSN